MHLGTTGGLFAAIAFWQLGRQMRTTGRGAT
jgi:hypothetical protein